jgi:hypothetical protein
VTLRGVHEVFENVALRRLFEKNGEEVAGD